MDKYLINRIKQLKQLQPCSDWKASLRSELLAHENFRVSEKAGFGDYIFNALEVIFLRLSLKPVYISAMAVFLLFAVSASAFVSAQKSLPGQTLYGFKIAFEKARVSLVLDKSNKIKKEIYFAGRRLEELNQLSKKENRKDMILAVENFHAEISRMQNGLKKLEQADETNEAVEAAKIIDEKTLEFEGILTNLDVSTEKEVEQKLVLAIKALDQANTQALGVIINIYSVGGSAGVKDLISRLEDKIARTEAKIENIDAIIAGQDLVQDPQGVALTVNKKIEQARVVLNEARAYLENDNLEMALEKVTESKDLTLQAGETLAQGEKIPALDNEDGLGPVEDEKLRNSEVNFPISEFREVKPSEAEQISKPPDSSNITAPAGSPINSETPEKPQAPEPDFRGGIIKEPLEKPGQIRSLLWKSKK